jgi:hypothetical protein
MTFYVYHKTDSRIATGKGNTHYGQHEYNTEGQAKAAITRIVKKAQAKHDRLKASEYSWDNERAQEALDRVADLAIAEHDDYHANIEQFETVYSIFDTKNEKPVVQSVNTPHFMSVSSESYWCM